MALDGDTIGLLVLILFFLFLVIAGVAWVLKNGNRSSSEVKTSMGFGSKMQKHGILDQYSRNLTEQAKEGKLEPVIGREKEIRKVIQILSRKSKNNPVLVGKAGVGKTSIVEGLAQMIIDKKVPEILREKQVLALDLSSIIAGTKFRGEFEKRLLSIREEIIAANRNIILFIDEIHTLAEAGEASGAMDADDILKPALARGELQVVGATTNHEYEQYIAKDITLARRLQLVSVSEPTPAQTLAILHGIKKQYEQFHGVHIQDAALKIAVDLAKKYLTKRSFPDKAIDLIDEACAKVKLDSIIDSKPSSFQKDRMPEVASHDIREIMKEI